MELFQSETGADYLDQLEKLEKLRTVSPDLYKRSYHAAASALMKLGEHPYDAACMRQLYSLAEKFDSAREVLQGAKIARRLMSDRAWHYPTLDQLLTRLMLPARKL